MKKPLAALGASVLGLGTVAATPAAAEPPRPECTTIDEQLAVGELTNGVWYHDCVPQYGLGKVEFTIVPDGDDPAVEFPEAFERLDLAEDPGTGITMSTTLDSAAIAAYWEEPEGSFIPPIAPVRVVTSTENSQTYTASVIAPIATAGPASEETTPAGVAESCAVADWTRAWVATYDPIDTTFRQVVDGAEWSFTIAAQSDPTYVFIDVDAETVCLTDGETTSVFSIAGAQTALGRIAPFRSPLESGSPVSTEAILELDAEAIVPAELGTSGYFDIGVFERDAAPTPQLAATGSDASTTLIAGSAAGAAAVLGGAVLAALGLVGRRRRRSPIAG